MEFVQRKPIPLSSPGANGVIPVSDDEWSIRQARLTQELAAIDAEDDTPDEVYSTFLRNIDDERRFAGRPPAFGESS